MITKLTTKFGGENAIQYNALHTALEQCAKADDEGIYEWLEKMPKTSLILSLVNELNELGFEIKEKENGFNNSRKTTKSKRRSH